MYPRISAIVLAASLLAWPALAQVPPSGGAVKSVTGAGTVSCSPTTGAVICTGSAGSGMTTSGSNATSAALDAIATAAGQTAGLNTTDNPLFNIPVVHGLHIFGSSTGYASLVYDGAGAVNTQIGIPQTSGTPDMVTTGDTGTVTNTMLAGSIALTKLATQATNTITGNATSGSAAPTALAIGSCSTSASALIWTTNTGFGCNTAIVAAPTTFAAGTGATLTAPREYYECTTTCSIVLPTPAAGYEFCVRNANNVSTVITFAGITNVQFEVQAKTSYKTAGTSIVFGGAVTDQACWVGKDATHYDLFSVNGTLT